MALSSQAALLCRVMGKVAARGRDTPVRCAREKVPRAAAAAAWMARLGWRRLSSIIDSSFVRCSLLTGTPLSAMHSTSLGTHPPLSAPPEGAELAVQDRSAAEAWWAGMEAEAFWLHTTRASSFLVSILFSGCASRHPVFSAAIDRDQIKSASLTGRLLRA